MEVIRAQKAIVIVGTKREFSAIDGSGSVRNWVSEEI